MNTARERWFHKKGTLASDGWTSVIDEHTPHWFHTGILVGELDEGSEFRLDELGCERIVVPLSGSFTVVYEEGNEKDEDQGGKKDGEQNSEQGSEHNRRNRESVSVTLNGRASVFDGPSDVLYLSSQTSALITGRGRVAVATSKTTEVFPCRYVSAGEVQVELRGAGASSRQVHNFGTPENLDAARLIVCEVITPAQNWSSYPPHKHDELIPGEESRLEEIYYFECEPSRVNPGRDQEKNPEAFGLFSAYSSPAGEIEINAHVSTGDIALVPYGFHGPAAAAPGYDLYYLNVMAGPDSERVWNISDDPAHSWVRGSWEGVPVDPRLPYGKDNGTHQRNGGKLS